MSRLVRGCLEYTDAQSEAWQYPSENDLGSECENCD